jgi:hypothetical protein
MVYSGAWGKLINEKNLKSKISWHCPFKYRKLVIIDKKANYFHICISKKDADFWQRLNFLVGKSRIILFGIGKIREREMQNLCKNICHRQRFCVTLYNVHVLYHRRVRKYFFP